MDPTQSDDEIPEAANVGANTSPEDQPLLLEPNESPLRLQISGGGNLLLEAHPNGSIKGLQLGDVGRVDLEFPQVKDVGVVNTIRHRSIFSTDVTLGTLSSVVHNDRDAFRESRVNKTATPNPIRFAPYATVRDPRLRIRLVEIADHIEYLDRGFAEYFQAAGYSDDHEAIDKVLKHARQTVQQRKPSTCAYIGELGKFCESVFATWKLPSETTEWVHYRPRIRNNEDKIGYLQDALEIPYWEFMTNSFMDWRRSNPDHVGANGILYVLSHIATTCRRKIRKVKSAVSDSSPEEQEGVRVIVEGVEQRLELLDGVLLGTTVGLEDLEDDATYERPKRSASSELPARANISSKSSETSTLIGLVFLFLILSTTFFAKGFAISWNENKAGSFNDADFWYLCQSNAMSVLGSLAAAKPLLKHRSVDGTRTMFWLSFAISFAAAVISIVIYTPFNTCYSALVAFLGSIASAWSLVALTQATSQESHGQAAAREAGPQGKEKIS